MVQALLYQSPPRWRMVAAFAASILLHLVAIAAGATKTSSTAANAISSPPEVYATDESEPVQLSPERMELPLPPPPPDAADFVVPAEEASRPPPRRNISRITTPITHGTATDSSRPSTMAAAKVVAINAPRPDYPYEARRQRATGSGIAVLRVDRTRARSPAFPWNKAPATPFSTRPP